ncbi:MAG: molybdopterin synthase sulfur carrier subunit [Desulfurococcales archaeon ex4484_58]|nr:MAG: molybdopterin synthase sulfur carrier subunit [Desulfurococcales archaeon ex4484_58]
MKAWLGLKVKVKYLMWLRDKTGIDQEELELEDNVTLEYLVEKIKELRPSLKKFIDKVFDRENPMIILVNGVKAEPKQKLSDRDEIVFLPPVSGG